MDVDGEIGRGKKNNKRLTHVLWLRPVKGSSRAREGCPCWTMTQHYTLKSVSFCPNDFWELLPGCVSSVNSAPFSSPPTLQTRSSLMPSVNEDSGSHAIKRAPPPHAAMAPIVITGPVLFNLLFPILGSAASSTSGPRQHQNCAPTSHTGCSQLEGIMPFVCGGAALTIWGIPAEVWIF